MPKLPVFQIPLALLLLLTGCATRPSAYQAQVLSPAAGARVSGSTHFDNPISYTRTTLRRVDQVEVAPFSRATLIDPGTHVLAVQFLHRHSIPPDHAASADLTAALEAGRAYTLRSAETNDSVTIWLEDSQTKASVATVTTTREELPIHWADPVSSSLTR